MEHNQLAADGTAYDNGYGICLIPKTKVGSSEAWNSSNTLNGGYMSSLIHNSLVTVSNNLKNVLGNHLVNRNVLLSSNNYFCVSDEFTWTTSYAELMSYGQLTGMFMQYSTIYDDGEANYKLPLFNYETYYTTSFFWLRSVYDNYDDDNKYCAWRVDPYGRIKRFRVTDTNGRRPLIYIR